VAKDDQTDQSESGDHQGMAICLSHRGDDHLERQVATIDAVGTEIPDRAIPK
jgi:hypothetical protein